MEDSLIKYLENEFPDIVSVISVHHFFQDDELTFVRFIYKNLNNVKSYGSEKINTLHFKAKMRDIKIENIFMTQDSTESLIYTDEQLKKIKFLRKERDYNNKLITEEQYKLDKENLFKLGDRVFFRKNSAIITFVGGINKKGIRKYTVLLQDGMSHRFISGKYLRNRVVRERIQIPSHNKAIFLKQVSRFEKMNTRQLIRYKNNHSPNVPSALMYVLQDRENVIRKNKIC